MTSQKKTFEYQRLRGKVKIFGETLAAKLISVATLLDSSTLELPVLQQLKKFAGLVNDSA